MCSCVVFFHIFLTVHVYCLSSVPKSSHYFLDLLLVEGSALARMVLRYQRKSLYEDQSRSSSDVNFYEDAMEKSDDWTFLPDPLVDSVFRQSDDVDSEGTIAKIEMQFKQMSDIALKGRGDFYMNWGGHNPPHFE